MLGKQIASIHNLAFYINLMRLTRKKLKKVRSLNGKKKL